MEYTEALKKRTAETKSDLIGWIYKSDLFNLLDVEDVQTKGECEAWDAFMETLGSVTAKNAPVKMRNDVEDRAQDFGNEREETGFRIGFHVAMRLCMEGMNGGIR